MMLSPFSTCSASRHLTETHISPAPAPSAQHLSAALSFKLILIGLKKPDAHMGICMQSDFYWIFPSI